MEPDTIKMDFKKLVDAIEQVHNQLSVQAYRAVNTSLTLRNWLIGLYIREYEQHGADRAQYGESLLVRLSEELRRSGIPRSDARELRRYRLFYSVYPQIREALTPEFRWTMDFSFLNTSLNCRKKRKCSDLLKNRFGKEWMSTNYKRNLLEAETGSRYH